MSLSWGREIGAKTEKRFSPIAHILRCYKLREIERMEFPMLLRLQACKLVNINTCNFTYIEACFYTCLLKKILASFNLIPDNR
jgi:hypothetical protein